MAEPKIPAGMKMLMSSFGIDPEQVLKAVHEFGRVVLAMQEQLNRIESDLTKLRAELLAQSELFPAAEAQDREPTPEEIQRMVANGVGTGDAPSHP
jgi:restriction endonuclease Mrr